MKLQANVQQRFFPYVFVPFVCWNKKSITNEYRYSHVDLLHFLDGFLGSFHKDHG